LAPSKSWMVTVADYKLELAEAKTGGRSNSQAVQLNIRNTRKRRTLIGEADVVVSLLPVSLHYLVVRDCLKLKKHVVTASYLSQEMYGLDNEAREAAIIMIGEMGLDPGIDHMSAMDTIHRLQDSNCQIEAFRSYTGGLIAPESIDNPWRYKFTWNPRNVVLAGQGTAQYMVEGRYKYIPYNRVFLETEEIEVRGVGKLEAYKNRDSLLYKTIYGLDKIPTLIRYTLRYPGYCRAWNALVRLGWTDDTYPIIDSEHLTYRQLLESYLSGVFHEYPTGYGLRERLADLLRMDKTDPVLDKLEWLGIFEDKVIGIKNASPAQILLALLLKKWAMKPDDRDLVVMRHEFDFVRKGKKMRLKLTMKLIGRDATHTAMSNLVGLPIGIFVKQVLEGKIQVRGVHVPVLPEIYQPVLKELTEHGVRFEEEEEELA